MSWWGLTAIQRDENPLSLVGLSMEPVAGASTVMSELGTAGGTRGGLGTTGTGHGAKVPVTAPAPITLEFVWEHLSEPGRFPTADERREDV